MLEIKNLTKKHGTAIVYENLNFKFEDDKSYVLRGRSGSGKTTLLEMIAGLRKPNGGSVSKQEVSMSFQDYNLLETSNVLDNVMLAYRYDKKADICCGKNAVESYELKKAQAYACAVNKATEILKELGISDLDKFPGELSGGMKARVGIARALMKNAEVYLFDEPFAGLDKETIEQTSAVIKKYTKGKTVIAVIHDTLEVEGFGDVELELTRDGLTSRK